MSATLMIAPQALPPDWAALCGELNFSDCQSADVAGEVGHPAGRMRMADLGSQRAETRPAQPVAVQPAVRRAGRSLSPAELDLAPSRPLVLTR
jgi:hypothetical protein